MKRAIVPEGKFNTYLLQGFEWDDSLSEEHGLTIALIISEAIDCIADPVICELEKKVEIANANRITLGDLGCLVHAKVLRGKGTQVYLGLPTWCERHREAIVQLMTVIVASSFHKFIEKFAPQADWIFPLNFFSAEQLNPSYKFAPSWIFSDGVEKLSVLQMEMKARPEVDIKDVEKNSLDKLLERAHLAREANAAAHLN